MSLPSPASVPGQGQVFHRDNKPSLASSLNSLEFPSIIFWLLASLLLVDQRKYIPLSVT